MKNKISEFTFGTFSIGGGTVSGGREEINNMISRSTESLAVSMDKFAQDMEVANQAREAFKAQNQKMLDATNQQLGTNYSMEDLKKKDVQEKLQNEIKSRNNEITEELKKNNIDPRSFAMMETYEKLAEIISKNAVQIADETLADKIAKGEGDTELDINGEKVKVKLVRLV